MAKLLIWVVILGCGDWSRECCLCLLKLQHQFRSIFLILFFPYQSQYLCNMAKPEHGKHHTQTTTHGSFPLWNWLYESPVAINQPMLWKRPVVNGVSTLWALLQNRRPNAEACLFRIRSHSFTRLCRDVQMTLFKTATVHFYSCRAWIVANASVRRDGKTASVFRVVVCFQRDCDREQTELSSCQRICRQCPQSSSSWVQMSWQNSWICIRTHLRMHIGTKHSSAHGLYPYLSVHWNTQLNVHPVYVSLSQPALDTLG